MIPNFELRNRQVLRKQGIILDKPRETIEEFLARGGKIRKVKDKTPTKQEALPWSKQL